MHAIISDIHGNLEALEAVLVRIGRKDVICLGDVVCYGPDSIECVRKSAGWKSVIAGPMDLALLNYNPDEWAPPLRRYVERTRQRFSHAPDASFLCQILESYRSEYTSDGIWFFHGAPQNICDWLFPEEIYCPTKLDKIASSAEYAFIGGGSHIPGIFRRSNGGWEFIEPENDKLYALDRNDKTIITVGSVGQPRDNDPRAAYAVLAGSTIVFHRVDYDVEKTRIKIKNDPDIDDIQGDRLPHGR